MTKSKLFIIKIHILKNKQYFFGLIVYKLIFLQDEVNIHKYKKKK